MGGAKRVWDRTGCGHYGRTEWESAAALAAARSTRSTRPTISQGFEPRIARTGYASSARPRERWPRYKQPLGPCKTQPAHNLEGQMLVGGGTRSLATTSCVGGGGESESVQARILGILTGKFEPKLCARRPPTTPQPSDPRAQPPWHETSPSGPDSMGCRCLTPPVDDAR